MTLLYIMMTYSYFDFVHKRIQAKTEGKRTLGKNNIAGTVRQCCSEGCGRRLVFDGVQV